MAFKENRLLSSRERTETSSLKEEIMLWIRSGIGGRRASSLAPLLQYHVKRSESIKRHIHSAGMEWVPMVCEDLRAGVLGYLKEKDRSLLRAVNAVLLYRERLGVDQGFVVHDVDDNGSRSSSAGERGA